MSKSPAFQFYSSDFLVGTAEMSDREVGAYIRLLCHQWDKGALPNDPRVLAALATTSRAVVDKVLRKFTRGEDGMLRNAKLERVRKGQEDFKTKQAIIAKKSWEKRRLANGKPEASHVSGIDLAYESHIPESCSSSSSSLEEEKERDRLTPEEIQSIGKMDCYRAIDITAEFQKCSVFYKGKDINRRMFLYWLNTELRKVKGMPPPRTNRVNGGDGYKLKDSHIPGQFEGPTMAEMIEQRRKEQECE